MTRQNINIGTNANDGTGDDLRTAMQKINTNFTELYAETAVDQGITISGNNISSNRSNDDIVLVPNGTGSVRLPAITINDNNITATRSNDDLVVTASGTGSVVLAKVDINAGAIDGVTIGANSAGAVTTTSLVATTADINGGNVDGAAIGSTSPATGNFTSLTTLNVLIDSNIDIRDNVIKTVQTNSNLVLSPAGTGYIELASDVVRLQRSWDDDSTRSSSVGKAGDVAGMIAWSNSYIYVCFGTYDGSTVIWKRADLGAF
jgi:hypothetical protein